MLSLVRFVVVLAIGAILPVACTAQAPSEPPARENAPVDLQSIEAMRVAFASAYLTGNADAVAQIYTEDAVWQGNLQPTVTGRAAIAGALKSVFSQFRTKIDIFPDETHTLGNAGWERGRFTLTMTPRSDGAATRTEGRYMLILERGTDGMWRIARDIDNVTPATVP